MVVSNAELQQGESRHPPAFTTGRGLVPFSYFFFSGAMRLGLGPNQTFALQRALDVFPHLRAGITQRQQQFGLIGDVAQIMYQIRTDRTGLQVLHLACVAATLKDVGQDLLKLCTRHFLTLSPAHRRAAFSALLNLSKSRSFIRALWSCDLLFPIEHPIISAISLCSYPSMSCSTKMMRYPGGRFSIARSRFTRSIEPASTLSRAPMSFLGPSSCCGSSVSSNETSGNPFLRRCISTTFTESRCNHVENADSPRKVPILR